MEIIQEFYDMLAPVVKQAVEISENMSVLYHAIEDDLSIPDDEWKECQEIYEAIYTIVNASGCSCKGVDCTCGKPV